MYAYQLFFLIFYVNLTTDINDTFTDCLINVHESSCKEQVNPCGRFGHLSTQSMKVIIFT